MLSGMPAFAQHPGGHQGGERSGGRGAQHTQPRRGEVPRGEHGGRGYSEYHGYRGDYHGDHERERGHYDGRRFDGDYRGRYFGRNRMFFVSPFIYGGGYGFYYGGFQFGYDAWPLGWAYSDGVYVDEGPDGLYYMYDPFYPGARVRLSIVF